MNKKEVKPIMILYEFYCMGNLNFTSSNDYFFKKFASSMMVPYYKLEYFDNIDGVSDVIRYSRVDKNNNIVSYYTIRDDICITGTMNENDEEIDWNYNASMTNFVVTRFKAFKDKGIRFSNKSINYLFNNNNNNNNKLCRIRVNNKSR